MNFKKYVFQSSITLLIIIYSLLSCNYGNFYSNSPCTAPTTLEYPENNSQLLYPSDLVVSWTSKYKLEYNLLVFSGNETFKTKDIQTKDKNYSFNKDDLKKDGDYIINLTPILKNEEASSNCTIISNFNISNESDEPLANLNNLPTKLTNKVNAEIEVSGENIVSYSYKVDNDEYSQQNPISQKIALTNLTDGSHTLYVKAMDKYNIIQVNPTTYYWEIDSTAPTSTLENLPLELTSSRNIEITIAGAGVVQYKYKLDSEEQSNSINRSEAIIASSLSEGSHSLQVIGIDEAGNEQTSPTIFSWRIDLTPPQAVINAKTQDLAIPSANLKIGISSTNTLSYKYSLDDSAYSPEKDVAQKITMTDLSASVHTIKIIAKDVEGHWQLETVPTEYKWEVVSITSPTNGFEHIYSSLGVEWSQANTPSIKYHFILSKGDSTFSTITFEQDDINTNSLTVARPHILCNQPYYIRVAVKSDGEIWAYSNTISFNTNKFLDNLDGTITHENGRTWTKCSWHQNYRPPPLNDCVSKDEPNTYKASYCDANDNSCNATSGTWLLNGSGNSEIYDACTNLDFAGITDWDVPTKDALDDLIDSSEAESPKTYKPFFQYIDTSASYWTSSANNVISSWAAFIDFETGSIITTGSKTTKYWLVCVFD